MREYTIKSPSNWRPRDSDSVQVSAATYRIHVYVVVSVMATSRANGSVKASDVEEDVTRKQIRQLKEKDGNNVCADCGAIGHNYSIQSS